MLLTIATIITVLILIAVYFDMKKFIVPNWIVFSLVVLYPVFLFATPESIEWWWSIATLVVFLIVSIFLLSLNILGAGYLKLITALSLWIGFNLTTIATFIGVMILCGIVIALMMLGGKKYGSKIQKDGAEEGSITNARVPYAIAIAASFLTLLWTDKIAGFAV